MSVELMLLLVCVLLTAGMGIAALLINRENKDVSDRVSKLTAEQQQEEASKALRKKELDKDFNQRVLFPFAQRVFDKTQSLIPLGSKSFVTQKLIQAGYTKPQYPKIFLGIQLLACGVIFGFLFTITTFLGKFGWGLGLAISFFFGGAGYALPLVWLMQEAGKRQKSIQQSLADFLDLLVICVEAGLGMDAAISKIANLDSVKTSTYLREELLRYNKDVAFGRPRKEALLDMAARTGVDDFNTIINALVQAYEMGSSVAHTLRVQADTLRVKRLQKAEEKANKIGVKMVIPIYVFLFPAIFVTVFGPMGMHVLDAVMQIFGAMDK